MDHPLRDRWSFWCIQRSSNARTIQSENYESYLKRFASFGTVEQFWAYYSHTKRLNEMHPAYDIHLFRESIRPVWEDAQNASGGKLTLRLRKGLSGRLWEQLMLTLIGEEYGIVKEICGAIVSTRYSEDIISVWIANSEEHEMLKEFIKKSLNLTANTIFDYKPHNQSIKDTQVGGTVKPNTAVKPAAENQ